MKKTEMNKATLGAAIITLFFIHAFGQEMPAVKLNHLSYVLNPDDLKAISESDFINKKFIAFETRTAKADNTASLISVYLFGRSCYLEFFGSARNETPPGVSSLAFSVDKTGDLNILKDHFDTTGKTMLVARERELDGVNVPWFDALFTIDPTFAAQSRFTFWIMEYRTEYFKHRKFRIDGNELTRENYLQQYASERKNKIVNRFSGITMQLNPVEKEYLTAFFGNLRFQMINEKVYVLPDNFRFLLEDRPPGDSRTIASIEFETAQSFPKKETVRISNAVIISMDGRQGQIKFLSAAGGPKKSKEDAD